LLSVILKELVIPKYFVKGVHYAESFTCEKALGRQLPGLLLNWSALYLGQERCKSTGHPCMLTEVFLL